MRLPAWALVSQYRLFQRVEAENDWGETTAGAYAEVAGASGSCAHYPVSKKIAEEALLLSVRVERECYVQRAGISPQLNRIEVDGQMYTITLVKDWYGFAVLGLVKYGET